MIEDNTLHHNPAFDLRPWITRRFWDSSAACSLDDAEKGIKSW